MYYADALGFLGLPGQPPKVDEALKLDLVHLTVAPPWLGNIADILASIVALRMELGEYNKSLQLIESPKDIKLAETERKKAVLLGLQNSVKLTEEVSELKALRRAGVRVVGLAYKEQNEYGSGWGSPVLGLTCQGRSFLGQCLMNGLIVDLSHSSHQTARDALNAGISVPMMASHGGCYMKYHHIRNLPDDVLRGIADRGGVVGITLLTFTLDEERDDLYPFLKHLEHAVDVCGEDNVVIGSDAPYVNFSAEEARKNFELLKEKIDPLGLQGARYPEYVLTGPDLMDRLYSASVNRFNSIRTNLSPRVVDKVVGLNFRRFLESNL